MLSGRSREHVRCGVRIKADLERVLSGTPWMVGRHTVILKPYDEKLSASEIVFDRMEL
jgi:hypothetical protein